MKEHNGVKKIEYFVDEDGNRISGWVKFFHKNSQQLAFLAYLKNGMLHGHLDRFYENGSPLSKEHYQNGEKHGVCVYWRENGIKKEEGGMEKWFAGRRDKTLVFKWPKSSFFNDEGWKVHWASDGMVSKWSKEIRNIILIRET